MLRSYLVLLAVCLNTAACYGPQFLLFVRHQQNEKGRYWLVPAMNEGAKRDLDSVGMHVQNIASTFTPFVCFRRARSVSRTRVCCRGLLIETREGSSCSVTAILRCPVRLYEANCKHARYERPHLHALLAVEVVKAHLPVNKELCSVQVTTASCFTTAIGGTDK